MGKNLYFHFYLFFIHFFFLLNFLRGSVRVVRIGGPWTRSVGLVHGPGVSVFGSPRFLLPNRTAIFFQVVFLSAVDDYGAVTSKGALLRFLFRPPF